MSKRLIWNFEIAPTAEKLIPDEEPLTLHDNDILQWEARYFWPENDIIVLHGLDECFLNLSDYSFKHRRDTYFLLEPWSLNLKQRREKLFYKPMLATSQDSASDGIDGFGKKINLHQHPQDKPLPGIPELKTNELLKQIQEAHIITVIKELVVYRFASNPPVKMELSRLLLKRQYYYSLCLQGYDAKQIETMGARMLPNKSSCNYVNFLKKRIYD